MKIIKYDIAQDKKYIFYDMKLNLERARKFREEQAKRIEFFKLQCRDNLNLSTKIVLEENSIYEFYQLPICEEHLEEPLIPKEYQLYRYENIKTKYANQQKEFLEKYIEEGLQDYKSKTLSKSGYIHSYIFLNTFRKMYRKPVQKSENVVLLPKEAMILYLLEKGEFTYTHFKYLDYREWQDIITNFDFEFSSSFSESEINDLVSVGLMNKMELQRKIVHDYHINPYI